jgi:HPt (histidine-containing phosphotransfer) domain-containing protein
MGQLIAELPQFVDRLRKEAAAADYKNLALTAHQLKGIGGLYGLNQISTVAQGIEQALAAGPNETLVKQRVDELIQAIQSVEGYDRSREGRPELKP